jgi:hypothetical protein
MLRLQEFGEYSSDENTKSTCVACCKELQLCSTQRNCRLHTSFPCNYSASKKENHAGDRASVSYIHSPIGVAVSIEPRQILRWNVFIDSVCGLRAERRVFHDWARIHRLGPSIGKTIIAHTGKILKNPINSIVMNGSGTGSKLNQFDDRLRQFWSCCDHRPNQLANRRTVAVASVVQTRTFGRVKRLGRV